MDTNEDLRKRALRLVTHGVSQKVLAGKMGIAPSTFSKWLNRKAGIGPASVDALDGFNRFEAQLRGALSGGPVGDATDNLVALVEEAEAQEPARRVTRAHTQKRDPKHGTVHKTARSK